METPTRLAAWQFFCALAAAGPFLAWTGPAGFWSALYGGAVSVVNGAMLAWRRRQAGRGEALPPAAELRRMYRSALERFVVVALLFAVGFGRLQTDGLALVSGFVAGQLALVLALNKKA